LIPLTRRGFERDLHRVIPVLDDRLRIISDQAPGGEFTDFFFKQIVRLIDPRRPVLGVMCIAGCEMDVPGTEEMPCRALGSIAEPAAKGLCCHLAQTSTVNPALQYFRRALEHGISFRVRNDRDHSLGQEQREGVLNGWWAEHFREFDHEVTAAIDGVFGRVVKSILDIAGRQVEIATTVHAGKSTMSTGEFVVPVIQDLKIKRISRVGVRSRDDIGGSAIRCHAQHVEGLLDGPGAIVNAPEDMSVNVDHFIPARRN